MMPKGRRLIATTLFIVALLGGVATAQFGRGRGMRARVATDSDFDGRFNFCRLMYTSVVSEAGGMGWGTDYPGADQNLSIRLSELTKTAVSRQTGGEPNHLVVRTTGSAAVPVSVGADVRCRDGRLYRRRVGQAA